jgi:hypothetical protein
MMFLNALGTDTLLFKALAGILASAKVPVVILAVSKFGISAASKEILALSKVRSNFTCRKIRNLCCV